LRLANAHENLYKPFHSGYYLPVDEFYTVAEASKLLGLTGSRVRQLLASGELEGERDPLSDRWRVSKAAVHARREQRGAAPAPTQDVSVWVDRIAELERTLGRAEARLELTEHAESTLRESLERERERVEQERERADRLEAELREERSKGFWRRLFGG
jgi:excisionase family DNA binding protein